MFAHPPTQFRPAPFWWWVGEPLERARLLWQLEELSRGGIQGAVIGYNHFPDGRNDPGDPPVFSPAWWDLVRWLIGECRSRGMVLGFQDYTLVNPMLAEIGRSTPGMEGGELGECHALAQPGQPVSLACPEGCRPLVAAAYPQTEDGTINREPINLTESLIGGRLNWAEAMGRCLVTLVWVRPAAFDPMHPESGVRTIDRLYAPFERECPGEVGATLAIFFQDELDFGIRLPMWSEHLPGAFAAAKGYDLLSALPALWHDVGPYTAKVRVDYADAVTRCLEQSYFIPIFRWHEQRGTLFGNDNAGRGAIGTGRRYYGDTFRTMRWYSAPGTDDPQLRNPRAFAGLKVNSSIAQLYDRPRVWAECFHSSGWGATPAQIIAGLNEDFLLGANFVNLHGLYYTTFGSWWEWAAPDFHFRQPYWTAAGPMNDYLTRLSAVLSQGKQACDTAILYPITALEGGLNVGMAAGPGLPASLSEQQRAEVEPPVDPAEVIAFQLGRALVDHGENFDFVDFESLERAQLDSGHLTVAGGRYRALVLPAMSTLRFSTLELAREFYRAGGTVVAVGVVPQASERRGRLDPAVDAIVRELFGPMPRTDGAVRRNGQGGRAAFFSETAPAVKALRSFAAPDFAPAGAPLQALHRKAAGLDLYWVCNPLNRTVAGPAVFRAQGRAEIWDAWSGESRGIAAARDGAFARIELELAPGEGQLVVFDPANDALESAPPKPRWVTLQTLPQGDWDFELAPTLNNRHGDFRRPASAGTLGAEIRRFRLQAAAPSDADPRRPEFDDSAWPTVDVTFGQQFWKLGPVPGAAADPAVEAALRRLTAVDPSVPVLIGGRSYEWTPYEFSRIWGIERDPFLLDWRSGPHGLKKQVPDEFIDLTVPQTGDIWYLWSALETALAGDEMLVAGSRAAFAAWVNGEPALERAEALPPGIHPAWNLPYYESEPRRTSVRLRRGANPLLLRLEQPAGQRLRAYVALDAPPVLDRPALRWFAGSPSWRFNPRPGEGARIGWYRFLAPPGLAAFRIPIRGGLAAWSGGQPLETAVVETQADISTYCVRISAPSPLPVAVALRVEPSGGSLGGDSLAGPAILECQPGRIALGDWSAQGLAAYSGAAWYRRTVELRAADLQGALRLDLGEARAAAEVWWNGRKLGSRVAPPWTLDLTRYAQAGANRLEIKVANTLANHYSQGIPTPYFFPEQTVSGLLGPVRILRTERPA
jgi:hypothetical protein